MKTNISPDRGRVEICEDGPQTKVVIFETEHPLYNLEVEVIVKRIGFQPDKLNEWGEPNVVADLHFTAKPKAKKVKK